MIAAKIELRDIYWLSAYLEGEGWFGSNDKLGGRRMRLMIAAGTTDKDIAERVANILGAKIYLDPNPPHKLMYRVVLHGQRAVEWAMTLYSLMGIRRKSQIRAMLDAWKAWPRRLKGLPVTCHPDRKHRSRGLCVNCYERFLREHKQKADWQSRKHPMVRPELSTRAN